MRAPYEHDCSAFGRLDADDIVLVDQLRRPVGRLPDELAAAIGSMVDADQHARAERPLGLVCPRRRPRELEIAPRPPSGGACGCTLDEVLAKELVSTHKTEP